jgi:hypothetical protein
LTIGPNRAFRVAAFAIAAFAAFAPFPRAFVERFYSTFLYAYLQQVVTPASNLVPFALFDVVVIAVGAAWLLALMSDMRREDIRRRHGRWKRLTARVLARSIVWASVLYIAFMLLWGFNYRRVKLVEKLEIDWQPVSPDRAVSLAAAAVDRLNALHDQAHSTAWIALGSVEPSLAHGFNRAQHDLGSVILAVPARPKTTLLSPLFRLTGVEGMTDPLLETLIADSVLPMQRPFVIAHEWGHLAGFADEAEASFAGWLACVHGSAADQYSGWLFVYRQMMAAVPEQDRSELFHRLASGPVEDLRSIADRERQVSPSASRISSLVYDRYLKANRIGSGVANYDEVANLLLGVRFGPDWTPKLSRLRQLLGPYPGMPKAR